MNCSNLFFVRLQGEFDPKAKDAILAILALEPIDEDIWFGVMGHIAPNNVIILIDAMNSGVPVRSARSGAMGDDYIRERRAAYEKFFQMARQKFHKIIYVKNAPVGILEDPGR